MNRGGGGGGGHPAPPTLCIWQKYACKTIITYKIQQTGSVLLSYVSSKTSPTNFKTVSIFILHYTRREKLEGNYMVPRATNTKNFETNFKVSSQSRKFEFNVFSILHLNGHNV